MLKKNRIKGLFGNKKGLKDYFSSIFKDYLMENVRIIGLIGVKIKDYWIFQTPPKRASNVLLRDPES